MRWDCWRRCYFYPRSPCGERPDPAPGTRWINFISIHALLAESDSAVRPLHRASVHFYPRSPCGERRSFPAVSHVVIEFLSTLSLRRATAPAWRAWRRWRISIHALLAESDDEKGGAQVGVRLISIHALLAESDHTNFLP